MIKLIYCLRRRPDVSPEEFRRHWREQHAALVEQHAELLNVRRYVQTHVTPGPLMDAFNKIRDEAPYDGIAEIWYDKEEDITAAAKTEEGRAAGKAIAEDEAKFADTANCTVMLAVEHVIIG